MIVYRRRRPINAIYNNLLKCNWAITFYAIAQLRFNG